MTDESIQLLILDVDGVLTDGSLLFDEQGRQSRRFHIRDGLGVTLWRAVGKQVAILTSKKSPAIEARAAMMGVELLEQGAEDKHPGFQRILERASVTAEQTAYVGDDLIDLVVMREVAYPIAVADAVEKVQQIARYVTRTPGGHGAVREAVEHLLQCEDRWTDALRAIGADAGSR